MNVQYMAETIEQETIHAVVIQPTLLNLLLDEQHQATTIDTGGSYYPLRSLRHVVSSGEKLFTSTAEAFLGTPGLDARLWNMYGATEAGCTYRFEANIVAIIRRFLVLSERTVCALIVH